MIPQQSQCCKTKPKDKSWILMVLFVAQTCNHTVFLTLYYFCPSLSTITQRYTTALAIIFFYILSIVSYFRTVFTNNYVQQAAAGLKFNSNSYQLIAMRNADRCQKCSDAFKPRKAGHCSQCRVCTLKMDHHCPWTANCVGHRNHQPFLLFNFYLGIGGFIYCMNSVMFFQYTLRMKSYFTLGYWPHLLWGVTNVCVFPFCLMTISLTFYHFVGGALCNVTTIDSMKGIPFNLNPLKKFNKYELQNLYDRGAVSNLIYFFNNSYLFMFPQENNQFNDGCTIPTVPSVSLSYYKKNNQKRYSDPQLYNKENVEMKANKFKLDFQNCDYFVNKQNYTI